MPTSFDSNALKDRVAVVTGAAGGLGAAICERLHSMGAQVVSVDVKQAAEPVQVAEGFLFQCDLAQAEAIKELGEFVRKQYGRCDILVNNAAVSAPLVPLEVFPVEQWDRLFAVNLRAALLCAQALVPMMFDKQHGSIINIASIAAQAPGQNGAYGPAKAGLIGLTKQMAIDWGPRGVRSNSISPGMIRTPLSERYYQDPDKLSSRISKIPVRGIGQPMHIGDVVGFLASDAAAYVNGQDLVVDGGFLHASLANLYS
jgi:NAD(P)-dependent dehydrogenase (short-subunit alcohol dehydrogenase family)